VVLAAAALAAAGCASPLPEWGTTHVLRPGENLYRVSRYYGVAVRDIERANRIGDVTEIPAGSRLFIPGSRKRQPAGSLALAAVAAPRPSAPDLGGTAWDATPLDFRWPLRGRVSSRFGWRNGRQHEGIDIPARRGTPIRAAESGRVISSSRLGDYGRVVIIKHAGDYQTIYAHNRRNLVRKGDFVEKGQVIAEVGSSGNARGAHVHFEIRRARRPLDPARYLP
jgi:murein DD-endopeptidase MepM/ murein hydrolase activator NlpD